MYLRKFGIFGPSDSILSQLVKLSVRRTSTRERSLDSGNRDKETIRRDSCSILRFTTFIPGANHSFFVSHSQFPPTGRLMPQSGFPFQRGFLQVNLEQIDALSQFRNHVGQGFEKND